MIFVVTPFFGEVYMKKSLSFLPGRWQIELAGIEPA
ncbi:hypothetical protein LCUFL03_370054 [Latilactobacillus curvatus]|nr:hypothetical protein LCUFL03_370054 [Latilactobacillus curvatus]